MVTAAAALTQVPFEHGDTAFNALGRLRELRNHVVHYGTVVHTLVGEYLRSGRNAQDLAETYSELKAAL